MDELKRMMYATQKGNILLACRGTQTAKCFSDAYAFAWKNDVYPILDDNHERSLHAAFDSVFRVNRDQMNWLYHHIHDETERGHVPTFYELERKMRSPKFGRWELMIALKYFWLKNAIGSAIWEGLLKPLQFPVEAQWIITPFSNDLCDSP